MKHSKHNLQGVDDLNLVLPSGAPENDRSVAINPNYPPTELSIIHM